MTLQNEGEYGVGLKHQQHRERLVEVTPVQPQRCDRAGVKHEAGVGGSKTVS